jgi:hypothetical protein
MINIEQTGWDTSLYVEAGSMVSERIPMLTSSIFTSPIFTNPIFTNPMFTSQCEKGGDPHIVALVELDLQKMRVHIVLSRQAVRQRLQELEYPSGPTTGTSGSVVRVEELSKL